MPKANILSVSRLEVSLSWIPVVLKFSVLFDEDLVQVFWESTSLKKKKLEEWDNINYEHLLGIYTPNAVIAASYLILTALYEIGVITLLTLHP